METDEKIKDLKKKIRELEKQKNKGYFKAKIKNSAKAIGQSTKTVFSELGKAGNQVLGEYSDVDDVLRRLPA